MDKNLANYIFLDQTLYRFSTDGIVLEVEKEAKPLATTQNIPQAKPEEAKQTSLVTEEPTKAKHEGFEMKTKQLFVLNEISDPERDFLVKIFTALGLSLNKVDLLDISMDKEVSIKDLIYKYAIHYIVFFGEEAGGEFLKKLPIEIYKTKELKGVKFLKADTLSTISENQNDEKRKLWNELKGFLQS